MATIASSDGSFSHPHHELTAVNALRHAWVWWIALLLFPAAVFVFVMWSLMSDSAPPRHFAMAQHWFIIAMGYMLIAVPVAIFWRSHLFKAYWRGEVVRPRAYLFGMMSVWLTLEVGGLLSIVGCYLTHALLPNLVPAVIAFVLFLPLWPSGRAMVRHVGASDDPEKYEEPR